MFKVENSDCLEEDRTPFYYVFGHWSFYKPLKLIVNIIVNLGLVEVLKIHPFFQTDHKIVNSFEEIFNIRHVWSRCQGQYGIQTNQYELFIVLALKELSHSTVHIVANLRSGLSHAVVDDLETPDAFVEVSF